MALTDALAAATAHLVALTDALRGVTAQPLQIEVTMAADAVSDRAEADAIRRGQKPEQVAALKRALGL